MSGTWIDHTTSPTSNLRYNELIGFRGTADAPALEEVTQLLGIAGPRSGRSVLLLCRSEGHVASPAPLGGPLTMGPVPKPYKFIAFVDLRGPKP